MAKAAKAENAVLVGAGQPHRAVDQQALAQEQLGRGKVEIGIGAFQPQRAAHHGGVIVDLVFGTDRNLRQQRVLIEHGIADQAQFGTDDGLADGVIVAQAQRTRQRAQVKILPRQRHFDAVAEIGRGAIGIQAEILRRNPGAKRLQAHFVLRAITADQRPGHQAPAAGAFDGGHPAGQQQARAAIGNQIGITARCAVGGHCGRGAGLVGGCRRIGPRRRRPGQAQRGQRGADASHARGWSEQIGFVHCVFPHMAPGKLVRPVRTVLAAAAWRNGIRSDRCSGCIGDRDRPTRSLPCPKGKWQAGAVAGPILPIVPRGALCA